MIVIRPRGARRQSLLGRMGRVVMLMPLARSVRQLHVDQIRSSGCKLRAQPSWAYTREWASDKISIPPLQQLYHRPPRHLVLMHRRGWPLAGF